MLYLFLGFHIYHMYSTGAREARGWARGSRGTSFADAKSFLSIFSAMGISEEFKDDIREAFESYGK